MIEFNLEEMLPAQTRQQMWLDNYIKKMRSMKIDQYHLYSLKYPMTDNKITLTSTSANTDTVDWSKYYLTSYNTYSTYTTSSSSTYKLFTSSYA